MMKSNLGPEPSPDDVLQPLTGPYRITTMSVYDGAYSTIAIATDDVGRGVSPMRGLTAIVCYAGRILRAIKGGGGPRVNCFREEATWGTTDGREVLYGRQLSRIYVEGFGSGFIFKTRSPSRTSRARTSLLDWNWLISRSALLSKRRKEHIPYQFWQFTRKSFLFRYSSLRT
jgi:hypothetical protein